MKTALTIIAFADDVFSLNANLANSKLAWIAPKYGLVGQIGLPLTAKPLAPRTNLYAHEATFTTEGYAKLANAARTDTHAMRLRLTEGETFGLLLAHWRDFYGSLCDGMADKPHGPQFCKFALYKMHVAKAAGNTREAKRLASVSKAMKAEVVKERQAERSNSKFMQRML
mgnify:CR=1 FL=1